MATPPIDESLGDLMRLSAALAANEADFAHIRGALVEFQSLVPQIQEAATQQALLTSAKQEATRRYQDLLKASHEQAVFLRKAARVRYGRSSEKLAQLGVQPFRGRKAAAASKPSPAPETPPTVELSA